MHVDAPWLFQIKLGALLCACWDKVVQGCKTAHLPELLHHPRRMREVEHVEDARRRRRVDDLLVIQVLKSCIACLSCCIPLISPFKRTGLPNWPFKTMFFWAIQQPK